MTRRDVGFVVLTWISIVVIGIGLAKIANNDSDSIKFSVDTDCLSGKAFLVYKKNGSFVVKVVYVNNDDEN